MHAWRIGLKNYIFWFGVVCFEIEERLVMPEQVRRVRGHTIRCLVGTNRLADSHRFRVRIAGKVTAIDSDAPSPCR